MTIQNKKIEKKSLDKHSQPSLLQINYRNQYACLMGRISLTGDLAKLILSQLARLQKDNSEEIAPWFELWQEHCGYYFDIQAAEDILSRDVPGNVGTRLFLVQTYCKIILNELVDLILGVNDRTHHTGSLYDWIEIIGDEELEVMRKKIRSQIDIVEKIDQLEAIACSDLLATVYQEILPPELRHLLGEYYTPSWLVEYCINQVESHISGPKNSLTILDPASGSGSFLSHYIAHFSKTKPSSCIKIIGFDVNPLAVDFCRANTMIAASRSQKSGLGIAFELEIHLTDAVVDPVADIEGPLFNSAGTNQKNIMGVIFSTETPKKSDLEKVVKKYNLSPKNRTAFFNVFKNYVKDTFIATSSLCADVIVGNPPWITWDGLTRSYRDKVAPQWVSSTLVTNTGWRSKVSAGKTDFSSLFVYRAAERHANSGAIMVFALPMSLFQSRLSGAGFRIFRTTTGRRYSLVELADFAEVKVFPDAANRTSIGTFIVDRAPEYPIVYNTWKSVRSKAIKGQLDCTTTYGGPIDSSEQSSPIVAFEEGDKTLQSVVGKSDYRARGGVNTGGANTILWLEVIEKNGSLCTVRNVGKSRRSSSEILTAEVESAAVHPLLCGPDMRRWKSKPSKNILLLYSSDQPKKALPVGYVQATYPKAFDYISKFQTDLEGRKEYHRWGCSGPFYEVYRIGPYTFSPIKVVWQHTGYNKSLNVSVIDDRGKQLIIPDQKAILIPFDNLEEAHYVCAFLASSITAQLLNRYLGTDASTHILDYISLRKFSETDKNHLRLAELSKFAHVAVEKGNSVDAYEIEIDSIVSKLLQVRQ